MGTIQVTPGDPGRLVVYFPYSTERVAVIRTVPGRRWHAEEKYWTVPHTPETLERMRDLFNDGGEYGILNTGQARERTSPIAPLLGTAPALAQAVAVSKEVATPAVPRHRAAGAKTRFPQSPMVIALHCK